MIKEYKELIPFLFKKKRKKPTIELTVYEGLIRLDNKIYLSLRRWRRDSSKIKFERYENGSRRKEDF
ncbi:hypothetical protein [Persephonella sp.]